ncbi:MAG: TlpA family protein disulfide reductase, partial [Bradymonadaceae bacterium]
EPCVEELPHLSDWAEELRDAGLSDLSLIAVEESRSAVATFRDKHPETPPSRVVAKPDAVKKWFASIGLGKGAPLPVHAFVDGAGRVRCLRAGPVDEDDLPTIENMIEK